MNVRSIKELLLVAFVLVSVALQAQDCTTTTYLESQTIKAGEAISINAGTIINQPGKQFIVESDAKADLLAGKRIELSYGFKALPGSIFRATVTACDPGDPPKDPAIVYPNPTDGVFTVKASYKIDALRLTDTNGSVQFEKSDIGDSSFSVDISKLKTGYYILEIIVGKTAVEAVRIEKK